MTRVSLWGGVRLVAAMVSEAGAFLGRRRICTSFSQEKAKRFVMPYVLRLIAVSPKSSRFEGTVKVRRHRYMGAARVNIRQGMPWSEELDRKNYME